MANIVLQLLHILARSSVNDVLANHSFIAHLFLIPSSRMVAYHSILSCIIFYLSQHTRALCHTRLIILGSVATVCGFLSAPLPAGGRWLSLFLSASSRPCGTAVSSFQSED